MNFQVSCRLTNRGGESNNEGFALNNILLAKIKHVVAKVISEKFGR